MLCTPVNGVSLFFGCRIIGQICIKTENIMCTAMKMYLRFASKVLDAGLGDNPSVSYREICRRARVSPVSMDEILLDELGMDGNDLLDRFRGI